MTRLLQKLAKLILGTLLICGLTLTVTYLTIQTYVNKLLASYHIEVPKAGFADLFGGADKQAATAPPNPPSPSVSPEPTAATNGTNASPSPSPDKDRVQAMGTEGETGLGALAMTSQELTALKEKMSEADKQAIMALLIKIPEGKLQALTALLDDGLTEAELAQLAKEAEQELSPEDYSRLKELLTRSTQAQ
ncbi:hypothetical protein [Gorillibacterium sp. CAU 1737]|uniref:hypothetical protein n=1 Tax=Gorillibacterium sp. CAU 1737 TaxID=3140362 RepID=UPI0032602EB8